MINSANQNLIVIEGAATYERIMSQLRDVEQDEAVRHIQDFLKIYPEFAQAHNDIAVHYYRAGDNLRALAHYEKAHKLEPNNITFRKNLADFYYVELQWVGDAIQTYLDILKDNPFDTECLNTLGSISLQLGRRKQASQYFSRTLQLDEQNRDALRAMQELAPPQLAPTEPVQQEQPPQPPPTVSVQKQVQPPPPKATQSFQELFSKVKPAPVRPPQELRREEVSAPQAASPAPASSPQEMHRDAIATANSGNAAAAIQQMEKILGQYPDYAPVHNDLGILFQRKGDLQKSRRHHEEAARLQPANTIFQKNLADLLYVGFGELEEALTIYVRLQTKAPQDIEVLKAISCICQEVGQLTEARFFLEKILALQPWDRDAQERLKAMETAIPAEYSR